MRVRCNVVFWVLGTQDGETYWEFLKGKKRIQSKKNKKTVNQILEMVLVKKKQKTVSEKVHLEGKNKI